MKNFLQPKNRLLPRRNQILVINRIPHWKSVLVNCHPGMSSGISPGLIPYWFCLSSRALWKFFGNPSGVPPEIFGVSRRTPEEHTKESRRNMEEISNKPWKNLVENPYFPARQTDIFSCTICDTPMIKNVTRWVIIQLRQLFHFSKELSASIFSAYRALKVLISFSAIPGLR
jgi:hypothetical protein